MGSFLRGDTMTVKVNNNAITNGMRVDIPQLPFHNTMGELYMDENGTEVYMPETDEHTSFNLKLPYHYSIQLTLDEIPKIYF